MKRLFKSSPPNCLSVVVLVIPLSLVPASTGAAETDRITVEDPSTGAVKFKVTSDGNVTAGSISTQDDGAVLSLQQGEFEAASAVKFAVKDTAGSSKTVVTADGKLGIGTASPVDPVEISAGLNPKARFTNTTPEGYGEMIFMDGAIFAGGMGSFGSNYQGNILWRDAFVITAAKNNAGKIIFRTKNSGTYKENLVVDNAGNLGVGTSTPTQKLDVIGTVKATTFVGDGSLLTNLPTGGSWGAITGNLSNQSDLQMALDLRESTNNKGVANGYASLSSDGKVPSSQLPAAETQSSILSKVAAPTNGTVLTMRQGSTESASTVKFSIKDSAGTDKITATAEGKIGIGTSTPVDPIEITAPTNPKMRFTNTTNSGAGEIVFMDGGTFAGGFSSFGSNYATAAWRNALILTAAKNDTGKLIFRTKTGGAYAERLTIDNLGNTGIGTSEPSQTLEVNGGVRINTVTAKPECDSNARGTFWVTQKGVGAMDTLEVCIKDTTETYVWKAVW